MTCPDDLCRGSETCIHGDGNAVCPECSGIPEGDQDFPDSLDDDEPEDYTRLDLTRDFDEVEDLPSPDQEPAATICFFDLASGDVHVKASFPPDRAGIAQGVARSLMVEKLAELLAEGCKVRARAAAASGVEQ